MVLDQAKGSVRIAVIYVAVTNGPETSDHCARFVSSWVTFPPGLECELWVACNGGPLSTEQGLIFSALKCQMFPRHNDPGYDITAYMDLAAGPCRSCDAILCLGESIHFIQENWLARLVKAWERHGPGFYGPFGSNNVAPHLQTSAFLCAPSLLLRYPKRPQNRAERFDFEHGRGALWRRTLKFGLPVRCVTWDGEWQPAHWRYPQHILWRGDQTNLLMRNNHADAWERQPSVVKAFWSRLADAPFSL